MINRLFVYLGRHVDSYLLAAVGALLVVGLLTLYSASGESFARVGAQFANIAVALRHHVDRGQHSAALPAAAGACRCIWWG